MATDRSIAIVGGGPIGLALALLEINAGLADPKLKARFARCNLCSNCRALFVQRCNSRHQFS